MDLKRRENESKLDYVKRIVYGKLKDKTIDADYTELAPLVFGKEYSSDVARRMFYGARIILDILEEEGINNISDDELLKKTEEKIRELEKLKVQYQDQKREYKAYLRMDARWEHLIDEMTKSVHELNPINPSDELKIVGDKEATLILSDWHIGMENNTRHNVYNIEIAKERVNKLYHKVIRYCELNKVRKIHIEICGDMIHGLIHLGTRINSEEDSISQTMIVSEILSNLIANLANKIEEVNVYGCLGNHSRVSANVKESIDVENFERIITWYMRPRLENFSNVCIYDNFEDDIILYKVFDLQIGAVHGHKEKYSTAIEDLSKFLRIFIDELHLGHWHSHNVKTDNDMVTIVNGSFGGADEYSEGIRKANRPSQTLIIYNEEGQECVYNIKL